MRLPSWTLSAALHAAALLLLLWLRPAEVLRVRPQSFIALDVPQVKWHAPPARQGGGGGGGQQDPLPASRGRLPKAAAFQFTPPTTKPAPNPILPIEPALLEAPRVEISALHLGNPFGVPGPPSDGRGSRGGIGDGDNGGVGDKQGPRAGDSPGLGGSYSLEGITSPIVLRSVEPEFSEEARKARFNGEVVVQITVGEDGRARDPRVLRSAGLGLDEKALQAVTQWLFRPGRRGGRPVPVQATIHVSFRLL
jgi:TonB family protein